MSKAGLESASRRFVVKGGRRREGGGLCKYKLGAGTMARSFHRRGECDSCHRRTRADPAMFAAQFSLHKLVGLPVQQLLRDLRFVVVMPYEISPWSRSW